MVGFVRICERVVGKDEPAGTGPTAESETDTTQTDTTTTEEVPA
jgi:hypothetical protein